MNDIKHAFKTIEKTFALWWSDWVNQVVVSMAAVLCSLTLVLAPASLMGIMHELNDLSNGTRTGIAGWWKGFKLNFVRSLVWGAVTLVVFAILIFNAWFYYTLETSWAPILLGLCLLLIFVWFLVNFYTLGYLFLQEEKSLRLAWKNSILTILGAPFFNLVIGFFLLAMTILSMGLFLPLLLGTPSLLALLSILAVRNRLEVYGKIAPLPEDN